MKSLTEYSVEDFLHGLADRTPTPGGGSAAGLAGAVACAQARMVFAYSIGRTTDESTRERVEGALQSLVRADALMRALIARDAEAYLAMTQAAKAARNDPSHRDAHQDAIREAATVPLEMAAVVSTALATMDEAKEVANRHLLSDLGVAAVLADGAARATSFTVRVNVRELTEPEDRTRLLRDVRVILDHCASHARSIEAYVGGRLEPSA